jgi:hypothetical protein
MLGHKAELLVFHEEDEAVSGLAELGRGPGDLGQDALETAARTRHPHLRAGA